ncbi:MAG TPA: nitroreductase family protein [Nitrospira sp.]|nr:nitroreductase family protein [Nitrospira sp.]
MTVTEAAKTRRSIRKYTDEPMTLAQVDDILSVAALAPSPSNLQPWRVKVVLDHARKQELMAVAYNQKQVGAAAAVLVIYSEMKEVLATIEETIHPGMADRKEQVAKDTRASFADFSDEMLQWWGRGVSYIYMTYIVLAAVERGYGVSTMLGFDPPKVKALLGIPEQAEIPVIIAIGRPAEEGFPHHRHPVDRVRSVW